MKNKKSIFKRLVYIVLTLPIFFLILLGIMVNMNYNEKSKLAMENLKIGYPYSMNSIFAKYEDKFDEIKCTGVGSNSDISLIFIVDKDFEENYNIQNLQQNEFYLQIAYDMFLCFEGEIRNELQKEYPNFRWPISFSFQIKNIWGYKELLYSFNNFDGPPNMYIN